MPWTEAVREHLAGATCLWQDLDGLHVSAAPQTAPPTSILWGWRPDGTLLRVRLDGHADTAVAFVATHDPSAPDGPRVVRTVPWDAGGDGRVAAYVGPPMEQGGAGAAYHQVVIDSSTDDAGPVTFFKPARG
jgi:hypothetical protein